MVCWSLCHDQFVIGSFHKIVMSLFSVIASSVCLYHLSLEWN